MLGTWDVIVAVNPGGIKIIRGVPANSKGIKIDIAVNRPPTTIFFVYSLVFIKILLSPIVS